MTVRLEQPRVRLRCLVVAASPSPLLRQGLRQLPRWTQRWRWWGRRGSGEEVLALLARSQPDVLLLDSELPGVADLELLRQVLSEHAGLRVLVLLGAEPPDHYLGQAAASGATGFVLRNADLALLAKALRAVAVGRTWLQRELTDRLLRDYAIASSPAVHTPGVALSRRQRQVLDLLAQGLRTRDIARQLAISEKTVKAHLTGLFRKLGVSNRCAAVCFALRRGLVRAGLRGA